MDAINLLAGSGLLYGGPSTSSMGSTSGFSVPQHHGPGSDLDSELSVASVTALIKDLALQGAIPANTSRPRTGTYVGTMELFIAAAVGTEQHLSLFKQGAARSGLTPAQ
jgi:hypothetical protein